MANYSKLKTAIAEVIKKNGKQEITGDLLQNVLISMVNSLGGYDLFAGVATPATDPGNPDQNIFYLAAEPGNYEYFNLILSEGIFVLTRNENGQWISYNILYDTLEDIKNIKGDIEIIQNDISTINGNIETINENIGTINKSIDTINEDINEIRTDINTIDSNVSNIDERLSQFYPKDNYVLADENNVIWTDGYYINYNTLLPYQDSTFSYTNPIYVKGINKIRYIGNAIGLANPLIFLDINKKRITAFPNVYIENIKDHIYSIPENVFYIEFNCGTQYKNTFQIIVIDDNDRISDTINNNTYNDNQIIAGLNNILDVNIISNKKLFEFWESAGVNIIKGEDIDGQFINIKMPEINTNINNPFKDSFGRTVLYKENTPYVIKINLKLLALTDKTQFYLYITYTDRSNSDIRLPINTPTNTLTTLSFITTYNKTISKILFAFEDYTPEGINLYSILICEYLGGDISLYNYTPSLTELTDYTNLHILDEVINPLHAQAKYVKILPQSQYIGYIPEIGTDDFSYELLTNFENSNTTTYPILKLGNVNTYVEGGHTLYGFNQNKPVFALFEKPENGELPSEGNSISLLTNSTVKIKANLQLWHIVLVRNKNVVTIYLDGRKTASVTQDKILFLDNILRLGYANKFVQCRFFKGALTEDDVLKLFNNGKPFNYKLDNGYKFNTGKYKDSYTGQTEGVSEIDGTGPINVITEDNITFYRSHLSGVNYTGAYKFDITDSILNNKYVIIRCKIRYNSASNLNIRIFATSITSNGIFELKSIPFFQPNTWQEIEISFPVSVYLISNNTYTGINSLFFIDGNNTGNSYDLDIADLEITKLNCTSEYLPEGLKINKWLDTSGNNNTLMSNGSDNLYYEEIYKDVITGNGVPTVSPDFVGQICIDTANKTKYTAIYDPSIAQATTNDWIEK